MSTPDDALGSVAAAVCCQHTPALNAGRPGLGSPAKFDLGSNPLRFDPTRTASIVRQFVADLNRRYRLLQKHVRDFLVGQDALGMGTAQDLVFMARPLRRQYAFATDADKLIAFAAWLQGQIEEDILSPVPPDWNAPMGSMAQGPWTTKYIESAYRRGRANAIANKAARAGGDIPFGTFENITERLSKVRLLGTRAFEQLKGFNGQMAAELNRILAQGIADGRTPEYLARQMVKRIDNLTKSRARTIARTEIVHAHAEGQLDAFEEAGVDQIEIKAEWVTAGDERVCPRCGALEGKLFSIAQARGMIPLHPNCRCAWIPKEVEKKRRRK